MSPPRLPIEKLPGWPRFLTLRLAAAYLDVSPATFIQEMKIGMWPKPKLRGLKSGLATWDRFLLDDAANRDAGVDPRQTQARFVPEIDADEMRRRIANAKTQARRSQAGRPSS